MVEYALILVLVSLVVIAALMILGPVIGNVFSGINSSLAGIGVNNDEGGVVRIITSMANALKTTLYLFS